MGDLLLTHNFRRLVHDTGFEAVFCRKSDPESKGKIENVVKYVKYNFLRGRSFTTIDRLNEEALLWLERTGNGCVHASTKLIPSEVFKQEKEYLKPYSLPPVFPTVEMQTYYVRKDNTINYKGNYYTLPTGTYLGRNTVVYIHLEEDKLHLFDKETGKTLAIHVLCLDKGKLIRNTAHLRDRTTSLQELEENVKNSLNGEALVDEYLDMLRRDKSRYYRDNLTYIGKHQACFSNEIMHKAFQYCHQKRIYNATILIEVAVSLQKQTGRKPHATKEISALQTIKDYNITPEKTDINIFNSIFK